VAETIKRSSLPADIGIAEAGYAELDGAFNGRLELQRVLEPWELILALSGVEIKGTSGVEGCGKVLFSEASGIGVLFNAVNHDADLAAFDAVRTGGVPGRLCRFVIPPGAWGWASREPSGSPGTGGVRGASGCDDHLFLDNRLISPAMMMMMMLSMR
jgi:hypothetical protein